MKFAILLLGLQVLTSQGCDEFSWIEVTNHYDSCIEESQSAINALYVAKKNGAELCNLMERMIDCSDHLSICMDSHLEEAQEKLFAMPINVEQWSEMMLKCQTQQRFKRSPGRRGGSSRSSSSSSTRSRNPVTRVRDAVKGVFTRRKPGAVLSRPGQGGTGTGSAGGWTNPAGSRPGQGGSGSSVGGGGWKLPAAGAAAGGALAGAGSKVASGSKKGGILRKVGKYAVVGLAAYGTYKLGKSMAKGLRNLYDDDECWQYDHLRDQYACVCRGQCDDYRRGGASSAGVTFGLVAISAIVTVVYNRNWL